MGMRAGVAGEFSVRGRSEDQPLNEKEQVLSDKRKYRKFSAKQKVELVLASLRGDRSIRAPAPTDQFRGESIGFVQQPPSRAGAQELAAGALARA
jgi:hypothetical protein